jgi:hypothetical protein
MISFQSTGKNARTHIRGVGAGFPGPCRTIVTDSPEHGAECSPYRRAGEPRPYGIKGGASCKTAGGSGTRPYFPAAAHARMASMTADLSPRFSNSATA